MIDNTLLLQQLLATDRIALQDSPFLRQPPPSPPLSLSWDRVEGMLLGLAIGDALGNTTEGQLPAVRRQSSGEIRDYLPNKYAANRPVGLPSDDTQMAFWTLEQLLADGGLVPDHLAQRFCQEEIFGIGSTVRAFIGAYKDQGSPWQQAGQPSAGNGALMRIAPVLIPHLRRPSSCLWADTVLAGMITHNERASNSACVAFINLLWEVLCLDIAPQPEWWLETFCKVASQLEGDNQLRPRRSGLDYQGSLWKFTQDQVSGALDQELTVLESCNRWWSGAYLLETIPSVIYILCRWGYDPEEAIIRAVNDTKDNDTIAAIVGAAVGALHGKHALPDRWVAGLLGRTNAKDDRKVFELIEAARFEFG